MFSMTKLRDNSRSIFIILLFFFVASMTVGGLVGGANIITTIQSAFGKVNTSLYVGKVGDENISIQHYRNEINRQLNIFRNQGRSIDSRAIQNAGDFAWNRIVDRVVIDKQIESLELEVQDDEIFNFLYLTPPTSFQDNLKSLGLYTDENNNFLLKEYQDDVSLGMLPDTTKQLVINWQYYLKEFLADRKLQNLYKNTSSITEDEIIENYKYNNLNCSIDILSIDSNTINDSLISISEDEIKSNYEMNKNEKYKIDNSVSLEYVLWDYIDDSELDSLTIIDLADSLLQLTIDFATEAEVTSFSEALETYNVLVKDTIYVTEDYKNNSGVPFQMGVRRDVVRFAFDNNIGSTSSQVTADNGLAVFHIIEKNPEQYTPIDEVENRIKRELLKEKKSEYAQNILEEVDYQNSNWDDISNENELINLSKDESSTIGGNFKIIGRNIDLSSKLLNSNIDDMSGILNSSSIFFIAKLKNIDSFKEEDYSAVKDSIKTQLLNSKRNQAYNNWLRSAKDNLEIIDFRHKIF